VWKNVRVVAPQMEYTRIPWAASEPP